MTVDSPYMPGAIEPIDMVRAHRDQPFRATVCLNHDDKIIVSRKELHRDLRSHSEQPHADADICMTKNVRDMELQWLASA